LQRELLQTHSMALKMYIGRSDAKIDKGSRIYIPSQFRKVMGDETSFVARVDLTDRYLVVYPESAWEQKVLALQQRLDEWDDKDEALFMQFNGEATPIQMDEQGRFQIPKKLAERLGFKNEVSFVGMADRFAIWGREQFDASRSERPALKDAMHASLNKQDPKP